MSNREPDLLESKDSLDHPCYQKAACCCWSGRSSTTGSDGFIQGVSDFSRSGIAQSGHRSPQHRTQPGYVERRCPDGKCRPALSRQAAPAKSDLDHMFSLRLLLVRFTITMIELSSGPLLGNPAPYEEWRIRWPKCLRVYDKVFKAEHCADE